MVDADICVSSHLKEELAWAVDKWLWVISIIMLFVTRFRKTDHIVTINIVRNTDLKY